MLDRAVEELSARVRTLPSGAKSLAHLAVIVPTAQAGRRLRLKLAEKFGALIPPLVKTPYTLRLPENAENLATRTDDLAAFKLRKDLVDLRELLAPEALTFAEVAEKLRVDFPEESERWTRLAALEKDYLAVLAVRGKIDRIAAMKAFDGSFPGVEETLDYSVPDLRRLDSGELSLANIFPCATMTEEAELIAEYFAAVKPHEALPALCVADPELFPELESAFAARGLKLHNPSETPLKISSLGHLVSQLVALLRSGGYGVFSAFIRGGDVRRYLKRELELTDEELTAALVDLDNRQAEFLPEKIDDIAPKTKGTLRAIFEFVKVQLRKKSLPQLLAAIFKDVLLDERDPTAREFAAAAEAVSVLIAECGEDMELFELRLDEATYSLEPDEGEVILTDGWMELPFTEAKELVIAGFQEGRVPESTVGHPYLPDSLRRRLGLPDNAAKEARDRAILANALYRRREVGVVKIFLHSVDAKGNILKPSRLLFETADDAELASRVNLLYGQKPGTREGSLEDLPEAWKLKLPIPPAYKKLEKISPTRLDTYLRCPFTYYLKSKEILGDKKLDDRAEELAAWEYGNLAHEALEAFGLSQLKDSTDPITIGDFLDECVDRQLVDRFGLAIPVIVAMQGESVKARLRNFAAIQAERRAAGWRIVAVERKMEVAYSGTRFYGKCDRIDYNDELGKWCVIDYKTFDTLDRAKCRDKGEWISLQLPLYCAMLDADASDFAAAKRDRILSCYCVLGKSKDNVAFTEPMDGGAIGEAEELARAKIAEIERGIFWPPAPSEEWRYDYKDWLAPDPAKTVSAEWIRDQEARHA